MLLQSRVVHGLFLAREFRLIQPTLATIALSSADLVASGETYLNLRISITCFFVAVNAEPFAQCTLNARYIWVRDIDTSRNRSCPSWGVMRVREWVRHKHQDGYFEDFCGAVEMVQRWQPAFPNPATCVHP